MPDMNENAETQQEYFGKAKLETDYKDLSMRLYKRITDLEKENAELEGKISVLLSCKKCPENKGGLICAKEYEDKCLAQKIQFIKELQEENRQLKNEVDDLSAYCNQIGKIKTDVLKLFEHIVAR